MSTDADNLPSWASPEHPEDSSADLELVARAFMTALRHPKSNFRGAPALHDKAVVTAISRAGDPVALAGEQAHTFLLTVFNPDNAKFRMAAPEVRVEGNYGLVTRRFSAQEPGRGEECMVFHAEAWRNGQRWEFLRITLASMPYFDKCEIQEG
ncbi:hypothetical protein [Altererythrobacter litoralis]|uniref:DUF4440 domain-containing protein n=1 Tax=Altererythrobacter litoralis TaxID=3113904 RepID=A0ABU7GCE3_9SPHN|nr:hypothetical protein [Erythrobacteraceae bacterium 1XM1-14]